MKNILRIKYFYFSTENQPFSYLSQFNLTKAESETEIGKEFLSESVM